MARPVDEDGGVPTLKGRLVLENSSGRPFRLFFSSGQRFDAVIRNAAGEELWVWSANKLFTQATATIDVEGVLSWTFDAPLGRDATPWEAGVYELEVWLTNAGGGRFAGTLSFAITEPVF